MAWVIRRVLLALRVLWHGLEAEAEYQSRVEARREQLRQQREEQVRLAHLIAEREDEA